MNTTYNGSSVILSSGNLSGIYISEVFDAGNEAVWNNLSWEGGTPNASLLFGVDGEGNVFKSIDLGVTWSQTANNYGRTSDTSDMFSDLNYLYILANSNKEVWRSQNLGINFSVINKTFSNTGLLLGAKDSLGNLYVVGASGNIYKSSDFGVSWNLQGDFNGVATNNAKGIGIDSSNNIFIVDGSGSVFKSTNQGVSWATQTSGYGGGISTDDLEIDSSNNQYILNNKEIYKSTNQGVNWTIINNSFTSFTQTGLNMLIDSNNNFFITDERGRVFKSINSGISWNEIGDFNGAATNDPKGFIEFISNTNLTFQLRNCSLPNCSDGVFRGPDGTENTFYSNKIIDLSSLEIRGRYFQYKFFLYSSNSLLTPYFNLITLDYNLVAVTPSVEIILPNDGGTYGTNESLAISFLVSGSNLDSCWYTLNNGQTNTTISGCQNTTFSVPGNGNYNLAVYANESMLGLEGSDNVSFNVQIGAPSMSLIYPKKDSYINTNNVEFKYIAEDVNLEICELWGNFTGIFEKNQTDSNVLSGEENSFYLNLQDGGYQWNIFCNDSFNNGAFNENRSFYIDTINPSINLTEPSGIKSSRLNIPIAFSIQDSSPVKCWYNVLRGVNVEVANTTISCSSPTIFSVTIDADFVLNLFVNDSAGNKNSASSLFSVSTSSPSQSFVSSGGGGRGGSTSSLTGKIIIDTSGKLEIGKIPNLIINPGETKKMMLNIKNSGLSFLNDCKLVGKNTNGDWISSQGTKKFGGGESGIFEFSLNIPKNLDPGVYEIFLEVKCTEASQEGMFLAEVLEKKIEFFFKSAEREKNNKIKVKYSLSEMSGVEQNVKVQFILYDLSNRKITEFNEELILPANSKTDFESSFDIEPSLSGSFNLVINLNSEEYTTIIEEGLFLAKGVTGLAIFGDDDGKTKFFILVFLICFIIFAFFVILRIIKL
ncbi:MAG: hypothetical protein QXH60_03110, partial [Candidatus Pacearchaeota archaeon]